MPHRTASSAQAVRPLALVTGASAGLGAAFARAYAASGYDLALVARRAERLQALAHELEQAHGAQSLVIPADLSEFEAHVPVLDAIDAAGREVEVLINNAGFGIPQSFAAVPWSRQREFLMTMVVAVCGFAHGVIPGMVSRGRGSIINVSSLAAFSPGVASNSLYPGAKSLVLKFSQALAAEYGPKGVSATAVCPGFTRTEFGEKAGVKEIMDREPRMFSQTAEEVVRAAMKANARGEVVVIPGLHNQLAAFLMRRLPQALVRRAIAAGSAKYHLED